MQQINYTFPKRPCNNRDLITKLILDLTWTIWSKCSAPTHPVLRFFARLLVFFSQEYFEIIYAASQSISSSDSNPHTHLEQDKSIVWLETCLVRIRLRFKMRRCSVERSVKSTTSECIWWFLVDRERVRGVPNGTVMFLISNNSATRRLGPLPVGFVALIIATAAIWHNDMQMSACMLLASKAGANKISCMWSDTFQTH